MPEPERDSALRTRLSPDSYDDFRPRKQCAWCLLVMDGAGRYSVQPGRKIRTATHGICPDCKEQMRAEIDATPALVAA